MHKQVCPEFRRMGLPSRRELLKLGSLGLLGLTLPQLLSASPAPASSPTFGRAKRCIFLFMWGGPSQLETWDLNPTRPTH
jgi:hypothetical protein